MEERQSRLSSMVWRRLRPYFCVLLIPQNSMFSNFCHVLKCINKLQKGIEKEKVKIGRLESKGKDTTKSMDKIEDFNNRIDYLNRNKDNVKRLGTDQDNIYAIGSTAGDGVNTVRKDEDGKVVIQADGTARILHEITHIVQSLDTGGLLFSNNSILCNAGITFPREERDGMIAEYEVEAKSVCI